jgi:hypothetical protein
LALTSTHLVNLSTMTKMWVMFPRAGWKGPTISRHHTVNGHIIGIVFKPEADV